MAVEFWTTSGKTVGTQVKTVVGTLTATGSETTMTATEEPDEVRVYATGKSNGVSIAFTYSGGTVTFTTYTATAGDEIRAIAGDKYLFEDSYVIGNSSTGSEREMEQAFYIHVSGSNEENCELSLVDLVAAEGAATTWYTLTDVDDSGSGDYSGKSAGAALSLSDIDDGNYQLVYAKCAVAEDTAKQNARDVLVKFQSLSSATD